MSGDQRQTEWSSVGRDDSGAAVEVLRQCGIDVEARQVLGFGLHIFVPTAELGRAEQALQEASIVLGPVAVSPDPRRSDSTGANPVSSAMGAAEQPNPRFTWSPRGSGRLTITAHPARGLLDEPVRIEIHGVAPGALVTLRATAVGPEDKEWSSEAVYAADAAGEVHLERDAPVSGSYAGIDGMGLFWSLAPIDPDPAAIWPTRRYSVLLTATSGPYHSELKVHRSFGRHFHTRPVTAAGVQGLLVLPEEGRDLPGLVVMGGSEGGLHVSKPALLASHGYAVLSLAYFGTKGLPHRPRRLRVEYLLQALEWLGRQEEVDPSRIGAVGTSKGAEAALLLGTVTDGVRAVVVINGMTVLTSERNLRPTPPWTYRGHALRYVRATPRFLLRVPSVMNGIRRELLQTAPDWSFSQRPWFEAQFRDRRQLDRCAIPVEQVSGPILFITGGDDRMIPSAPMAELAMERLTSAKHPWPDRHVCLPDTGHAIPLPSLPTTSLLGDVPLVGAVKATVQLKLGPPQVHHKLGGTPEGVARGSTIAWNEMIAFLQAALASGEPASDT